VAVRGGVARMEAYCYWPALCIRTDNLLTVLPQKVMAFVCPQVSGLLRRAQQSFQPNSILRISLVQVVTVRTV
jgi:hypothetical protein